MKKQLTLAMLALLAVIVAGCSNSPEVEAELKAMYKKVPADAEMVISGSLKKIVEQFGGKVKDGSIEWGKDAELPELAGGKKSGLKDALKEIHDLSEGIDASAFVGFVQKGQFYGIFKVRDLAALKASIDEHAKGPWEKFGKIEYKKGYYLTDNGEYLWIAEHVNFEVFEDWQILSEVGSFLGNEYAAKMAASTDAVNLWASLDGLYSKMSFSEQAQARLMVGMLFEQPKYFVGHANFDKKSVNMEMYLTTSDYKPAKCVIDVAKIDPAVVSGLGGNANVIAAVNISQNLVGQIKDLGKSMGSALPGEVMSLISPLDGTMAGAFGNLDNPEAGYKAVVTTNGQEDAALAQFLGTMGNVTIKGKSLGVSKGNYGDGMLVVADAAKKMKDAWLAVALAGDEDGISKKLYILLEPADGTLRLTVEGNW